MKISCLLKRQLQIRISQIPLKAYFNERGFAKIELGLGKGKKLYDKREDLKRREAKLEMSRALKRRR